METHRLGVWGRDLPRMSSSSCWRSVCGEVPVALTCFPCSPIAPIRSSSANIAPAIVVLSAYIGTEGLPSWSFVARRRKAWGRFSSATFGVSAFIRTWWRGWAAATMMIYKHPRRRLRRPAAGQPPPTVSGPSERTTAGPPAVVRSRLPRAAAYTLAKSGAAAATFRNSAGPSGPWSYGCWALRKISSAARSSVLTWSTPAR